jgi:hypothetical protein
MFKKERLLEQMALELFSGAAGYITYGADALAAALKHAQQSAGLSLAPGADDAFLRELLESGLLQGNDESGYFFAHLTIQEYLAAAALSRMVETPLTSLREFVRVRSWDERWAEVIALLTSLVDEPEALLEDLLDPQQDDIFRHRLALATRCLAELPEAFRKRNCELVNRITKECFTFWREHIANGSRAIISHFLASLPALAIVNGEIDGCELMTILSREMSAGLNSESRARGAESYKAAVETLMIMGPYARSNNVLKPVYQKTAESTDAFIEAVALLIALQPDEKVGMEKRLVRNLRSETEAHRRAALRILAKVGHLFDGSAITDALSDILQSSAGSDVMAALKGVGSPAATPVILAELAKRFGRENNDGKVEILYALQTMGPRAASPEILHRLVASLQAEEEKSGDLLKDSMAKVPCLEAAEALIRMGPSAATREVLGVLASILREGRKWKWKYVAEVLESMGEMAASDEIVDALVMALEESSAYDRDAMVRSLVKVNPKGVQHLVERYLILLRKRTSMVEALRGLRGLGEAAATDRVITEICSVIATHDCGAIESAQSAWALKGMGNALHGVRALEARSALIQMLDRLLVRPYREPPYITTLSHLAHPFWSVVAALDALGSIEPVTQVSEDFIIRLVKRLKQLEQSSDTYMLWSEIPGALGKIGEQTGSAHAIEALLEWSSIGHLGHDSSVRALTRLFTKHRLLVFRGTAGIEVRTIDELSSDTIGRDCQ